MPINWVDDEFIKGILTSNGFEPLQVLTIPLQHIDWDNRTQTRFLAGSVNKGHVEDLTASLSMAPNTCKMVSLFRAGPGLPWKIVDGWHRCHAVKALGESAVVAYCCESEYIRESQLQAVGVQANTGQVGSDRSQRTAMAIQRLMAATIWVAGEPEIIQGEARDRVANAFRLHRSTLLEAYNEALLRKDVLDNHGITVPSDVVRAACDKVFVQRKFRRAIYLPLVNYICKEKPSENSLTGVLQQIRKLTDQETIDYLASITDAPRERNDKKKSPGEKIVNSVRRLASQLCPLPDIRSLDLTVSEIDTIRDEIRRLSAWSKKVIG